jgi:hypothetical protein
VFGLYPIVGTPLTSHSYCVKPNYFPKNHVPDAPRAVATELNQNEIKFAPSPDEVARKAYFAYENEGSLPGREVQHWLKAEADLIAERNQTRVHGFHNKT